MAETPSRGPIASVCAAGAAIALVASLAPWSPPHSASPAAAGQAAPAGKEQDGTTGPLQATKNGARQLAIELRLDKQEYMTSDKVNATIIFRNVGETKLKFPAFDGRSNMLLVGFLLAGNSGLLHTTSAAYPVHYEMPRLRARLISLGPGETHTMAVRDVLPLRELFLTPPMSSKHKVLAIYRDRSIWQQCTSQGYWLDDPWLWKGIAISNAVTIKKITPHPDDRKRYWEYVKKQLKKFGEEDLIPPEKAETPPKR